MASTTPRQLAREFKRAGDKANREVPKIVAKTALLVKRKWALELKARSLVHAGALPYAVNYDTRSGAGYGYAEVGPDKGRRQGALGNLLEFGAPERDTEAGEEGLKALESEEQAFFRYIDEATKGLD